MYGWTREDFLLAVGPNTNNITKQQTYGEQAHSSLISSDHATPLLIDSSVQGSGLILKKSENDILFSISEQSDQ